MKGNSMLLRPGSPISFFTKGRDQKLGSRSDAFPLRAPRDIKPLDSERLLTNPELDGSESGKTNFTQN